MNFKLKTWNKKQQITAGVVVAVLIFGGVGGGVAIHQQNVHAQQIKIEQAKEAAIRAKVEKLKAEKEAENKAEKAAQVQLISTEKAPTTDNIKKSETVISNVKSDKMKATLNAQLKDIQNRVALENTAKGKTNAYQVDAMNTDKYNQAKTAISKLVSVYSTALKDKLTKDLEASKAQADKARQAEATAQATQQTQSDNVSQTSNPSQVSSPNYTAQSQGGSTGQASAPSYTAPASQAPAAQTQAPAYQAPAQQVPTQSTDPTQNGYKDPQGRNLDNLGNDLNTQAGRDADARDHSEDWSKYYNGTVK